jgi:hypothetical protein
MKLSDLARILFVFVALSCAFAMPLPVAAQTSSSCATSADQCDQGKAFDQCKNALSAGIDYILARNRLPDVVKGCVQTQIGVSTGYYECALKAIGYTASYNCFSSGAIAQAQFVYVQNCGARPLQENWCEVIEQVCYGGCRYQKFQNAQTQKYFFSTNNFSDGGNYGVCVIGSATPFPTDCPPLPPPDPPPCTGADCPPPPCTGTACNPPPSPPPPPPPCTGDACTPPAPPPCTGSACTPPTPPPVPPPTDPCSGSACVPAGDSSGGLDCASPPVSTGDKLLAAVIYQQWLARCGPDKSDLDADGQPDWTRPSQGDRGDPDDGQDGEPGLSRLTVSTSLLDTGGIVGGGSCPQFGVLDFGKFGQVSLDGQAWWCTLVSLIRAVVLMMGAFTAVRILMGE